MSFDRVNGLGLILFFGGIIALSVYTEYVFYYLGSLTDYFIAIMQYALMFNYLDAILLIPDLIFEWMHIAPIFFAIIIGLMLLFI